jgi:tetratricopeptide (TPR) repeat protein
MMHSRYRGDLLPGFVIDDAPEFDRWLEEERSRLRTRVADAAWQLALQREKAGDAVGTVQWARRAAALSPADESVVCRLMKTLERVGDRAAAVQAYEDFAALLHREYELEPSPETVALAESMRQSAVGIRRTPRATPALSAQVTEHADAKMATVTLSHRGSMKLRWLTAAGVTIALAVFAALNRDDSLVGEGLLPPNPLLVLADVQDSTSEDVAASFGIALRAYLGQSTALTVMPIGTARDVVQRMGLQRDTVIDVTIAREIAEREGAAGVIGIQFVPAEKGFELRAQVLDQAGAELQLLVEPIRDTASIVPGLARFAGRLGRMIARSGGGAPDVDPLPAVTTESLQALKLFAAAARVSPTDTDGEWMFLRQAIQEDSLFAMAYRRLGVSYRNHARWALAEVASRRAFELRHRLPEPDRSLVEIHYYMTVEYDWRTALALRESLNRRYPGNAFYAPNAADHALLEKRFADAARISDSALAVRKPATIHYANLFYALVAQKRMDEAWHTIRRARADFPKLPMSWVYGAHVGEGTRDYTLARVYFDSIQYLFPNNPGVRVDRTNHIRAFAIAEGRLASADSIARTQYAEAVANDSLDQMVLRAAQRGSMHLRLNHDTARALSLVADVTSRVMAEPHRSAWTEELIALYAEAGRVTEARRLFNAWRSTDFYRQRGPAAAALALAEGSIDDAIQRYEWLNRFNSNWDCPDSWTFFLGRAHDAAAERALQNSLMNAQAREHVAAAIAAYTAGVEGMGCFPRDLLLPHALHRLATMHDERGDRDKAVAYYRQLVDLWKNADPAQRAQLATAQKRIAALTATK